MGQETRQALRELGLTFPEDDETEGGWSPAGAEASLREAALGRFDEPPQHESATRSALRAMGLTFLDDPTPEPPPGALPAHERIDPLAAPEAAEPDLSLLERLALAGEGAVRGAGEGVDELARLAESAQPPPPAPAEPVPRPVATGVQAEALGEVPAATQAPQAPPPPRRELVGGLLDLEAPGRMLRTQGDIIRGLAAGGAQIVSGAAGAAEAAAPVPWQQHIAKVVGDAAQWAQQQLRPEELEGVGPFDRGIEAIQAAAAGDLAALSDPENVRPLVYALAENMPVLAGGVVAGLTTGPAGGFLFMAAQEGGHHYRDLIAQGVDEASARMAAAQVGVANGLMEYLPIGRLLRRSAVLHRGVKEVIKESLTQGTAEGLTEGGQEFVTIMSEWHRTGEPPEGAQKRILESMGLGVLLGMGMGGGNVMMASEEDIEQRVRSHAEELEALNQAAVEAARKRAEEETAPPEAAPEPQPETPTAIPQDIDVGLPGLEPPGELGGEPPRWVSGLPGHVDPETGEADYGAESGEQYVVMIRAEDDPERSPRPKGGRKDKQPHLTIKKTSPDEWAAAIEALLSDGKPRTLNAIGVELIDKTADVTGGTNVETGLWRLVASGRAEHTARAPVRFRLKEAPQPEEPASPETPPTPPSPPAPEVAPPQETPPAGEAAPEGEPEPEAEAVPEPGVAPEPPAPEPPAAEPEAAAPPRTIPPERPRGNRGRAITAAERELEFEYRFVAVEDVEISHDENFRPRPGFPAGMLQNRERDRKSMREQVESIAKNPDYERLADNRHAQHGAPWISEEDNRAEAGHGRLLGLQKHYDRLGPDFRSSPYRQALLKDAERLGLDPAEGDAIPHVVLVRQRKTPVADRGRLIRELNDDATAQLSEPERALSDAALITDDMLRTVNPNEDGVVNASNSPQFVEDFFQKIATGAQANQLRNAKGELNSAGRRRIRNALLAKAFGEPEMLAEYLENEKAKRVAQGLLRAVPQMIQLQGDIAAGRHGPEVDIKQEVLDALDRLNVIRRADYTIDEWLGQGHLIPEEAPSELHKELVALLHGAYYRQEKGKRVRVNNEVERRYMDENEGWEPVAGSSRRIGDVLRRYVELLEREPDARQGGLFGEAPPFDKLATFREAVATYEEQGSLFGEDAEEESFAGYGYYAAPPQADPRAPHEPLASDRFWGEWYIDHQGQSPEAKKVYRQVIKAIHPDYATPGDAQDLARRERYAQVANSTEVFNNVERLQQLLEAFNAGTPDPPTFGARMGGRARPRPTARRPGAQARQRRPSPGASAVPPPPPYTRAARSVDTEPQKLRVELPELIDFVRELTGGDTPHVRVTIGRNPFRAGAFDPRTGKLYVRADQAQDPQQLSEVLAHEIGHLLDWLPDKVIARGRIIAHLIKVHKYARDMVDQAPVDPSRVLTDKERARVNREADRRVRAHFGMGDRAKASDWRTWKRENPERLREWRDYYRQELLQEHMDARGLVDEETLLEELWQVTQRMRPIPVNASQKYMAYRRRPTELYADAFSMLINDPAQLKHVAPTYHSMFFNYFERNPDAANAYAAMQLRMAADRESIVNERLATFINGQAAALEHRMERPEKKTLRERAKAHIASLLDSFMTFSVYENHPLAKRIARAQKKDPDFNDDENPLHYIDKIRRAHDVGSYYMHQFRDHVFGVLLDAGVDINDYAAMLALGRMAGERRDIANPRGFQKEIADELLEELAGKYSNEQLEAMALAHEKWWELRQEVLGNAAESGLLTPAMREKVMSNPLYVRFQVDKFIDQTGGAADGPTKFFKSQVGTFADIGNAVYETVLIDLAISHAAIRNQAARKTAAFFRRYDPVSLRTLRPHGSTAPMREEGFIAYMENGKRQRVALPRGVVNWAVRDAAQASALYDVFNAFHNGTRRLLIDYNIGWSIWNLQRDLKAFQKQVVRGGPIHSYIEARRYLLKSLPETWRFALFGKASDDILDMMRRGLYIQSGTRLYEAADRHDHDAFRLQMAQYGVQGPGHTNAGWRKWAAMANRVLTISGEVLEKATKVAGYKYLKANQKKLGLSDLQIDMEVRERVGTPDVMRRGTGYSWTNRLFLFSNVNVQGWRAAFGTLKDRPGEYILKTFAYQMPKFLMIAAQAGLLDAWLGDDDDEKPGWWERQMRRIPEYVKTNYHAIPIAEYGDETVYLPVPQDHVGQLLGALIWKVGSRLSEDAENDVEPDKRLWEELAAVLFDALPAGISQLHPTLQSAMRATTIAQGANPYDFYRHRHIINPRAWADGDKAEWYAHEWNQYFGGFYRWRPRPSIGVDERSALQRFQDDVPILGPTLRRAVRSTDMGVTEELYEIVRADAKEAQRATLARDMWLVERMAENPDASARELYPDFQADVEAGIVPPWKTAQRTNFNRRYQEVRASHARGIHPVERVLASAGSKETKRKVVETYEKRWGPVPDEVLEKYGL